MSLKIPMASLLLLLMFDQDVPCIFMRYEGELDPFMVRFGWFGDRWPALDLQLFISDHHIQDVSSFTFGIYSCWEVYYLVSIVRKHFVDEILLFICKSGLVWNGAIVFILPRDVRDVKIPANNVGRFGLVLEVVFYLRNVFQFIEKIFFCTMGQGWKTQIPVSRN